MSNLSSGNALYDMWQSRIKSKGKGWILHGDNYYINLVENNKDAVLSAEDLKLALFVEFASFNGCPREDKIDELKLFLRKLYPHIAADEKNPRSETLKFQYQIALGIAPLTKLHFHTILFRDIKWTILINPVIPHQNEREEKAIKCWLEPLFEIIDTDGKSPTTDTITEGNTAPKFEQVIAQPTTAANLSYRVGRENDNEQSLRDEILGNLSKLPAKPLPKQEPTIEPPKNTTFVTKTTSATRTITLPISEDYVLILKDRFGNEMMSVPYNKTQKRITLPINTLGSYYEIENNKTRFYIHAGIGELDFNDALKKLDFEPLKLFCLPLADKKENFVILQSFLNDLQDFLQGKQKRFDSEVSKAIDLFLFIFERNKQKGKNYLQCPMIEAIDKALAI